jgi:hypothetical protein
VLLDLTDLGQSWTTLSEYLFEDLDFEYLFDADMDGVEDDPLAHKTSSIDVRPLADWFAPFNIGARVHPRRNAVSPHATRCHAVHTITDVRARSRCRISARVARFRVTSD